MSPPLAWTLVDGLAGAGLGALCGLGVGFLAQRLRPAPRAASPSRDVLRTHLRALAPLASDDLATRRRHLESAWTGGLRDAVVERWTSGDDRFVHALLAAPGLRPAVATALRALAAQPDAVASVHAALLPVARAVPLRTLLPAEPEARRALVRTVYERLAKSHVVRALATLDLRRHLRAADVVAVMDDDLLRRTTARLLRLFAADKDRLRKLHGALGDAWGEHVLLSVGPFQLTVHDLLRKFVTVPEAQARMTQGSNLLEKPMDPRTRKVRDAAVDASLGWLDAWMELAPDQRLRAATVLHDKLLPVVLPVVDDALFEALANLTLADVLDAVPATQWPRWLATVAARVEGPTPDDAALESLATASLLAWRALPDSDRRALVTTLADALAPPTLDLAASWLALPAVAERLADPVALDALADELARPDAAPPSVVPVAAVSGALAGLVASLA